MAAAGEYLGYEPLLNLPDKERGGAEVLGWDARRLRRWLGRLGDPQLATRQVLVAGSKGKGSTAAMLEAILRRGGLRTGLYAQPHLHRYAERIRLDGRPVPAEESRAGLLAVLAAAPGPVTAFEAATAYAFWTFAQARVDLAILEMGFGGRLDAVAEADPELVLFGPYEAEHADILGPGVRDVAARDLGLCRYGRTCLFGPQPSAVAALLAARLAQQGCPPGAVPLPEALPDGRVRLQLPGGVRLDAALGLPGPFQRENAALAAAGAAALGMPRAAIAAGLASVRWPARLERVADRPAVIVDGAHTPLSAQAVAAAVSAMGRPPRLALVVGLLAGKDVAGFARPFTPLAPRIWATRPDHPRAMPAAAVAAAFAALPEAQAVTVSEPVPAAVAAARAWAGPTGLCLVTGSLYVAAQARAALGAPDP